MKSADLQKICFPIDGWPAINRALEVYESCGIAHQIVVVEALAGQCWKLLGKSTRGSYTHIRPSSWTRPMRPGKVRRYWLP